MGISPSRALAERYGLKLARSQLTDPPEIVHSCLRYVLNRAQLTTMEHVDFCAKQPKHCPG